ncbi:hypothetical protein KR200_003535 [Drosophila serrata]|nr:hypothetical protein KR200_003535 [Drosophila serrata]
MSRLSRSQLPGHNIGTRPSQTDDDKLAERNSMTLVRCLAQNALLREELVESTALMRAMRKLIVRMAANQRRTLLDLKDIQEAFERRKAVRSARFGPSRSVVRPRWSALLSFLGWVRDGAAVMVSIAPRWINFLIFDQARRLNNSSF